MTAAADGVFVHPRALCESARVGARTRVWAFAHVMDGAVVGADCNVGEGAFVESGAVVGDRVTVKNGVLVWDGVTLEDDVFVGPGTCFTNDLRPRAWLRHPPGAFVPTRVRHGASLGANCTVVCGVEIGEYALVAAGSVVVRDVPAHALVAGNPARQRGWVCEDGERLGDGLTCPRCGRSYPGLGAGPATGRPPRPSPAAPSSAR